MPERPLFKYKRVAIDFDGTLVNSVAHQGDGLNTDDYFNNDVHIPAQPGAAEVTHWLKDQGFEILIFTCRPDYQRRYMEKVLETNGIYHDYILFYTKPLVDLYIDDKGFRFVDWQQTKDWIAEKLNDSMEPQNDFEDLLRLDRVMWTLNKNEDIVLDIGCGSGRMWSRVDGTQWRPKKLYGVEPNDRLRELARQARVFNLVYESDKTLAINSCTVSIFGVLEHVDDPAGFLEKYSDAKAIALTVPNANSFHRVVGVYMGEIESLTELGPQDLKVEHKRVFTYNGLRSLLEQFANHHGFRIERYGTCGFKLTTSQEMMQFKDRYSSITNAAETTGMIGWDAKHGAEIFARLEKI